MKYDSIPKKVECKNHSDLVTNFTCSYKKIGWKKAKYNFDGALQPNLEVSDILVREEKRLHFHFKRIIIYLWVSDKVHYVSAWIKSWVSCIWTKRLCCECMLISEWDVDTCYGSVVVWLYEKSIKRNQYFTSLSVFSKRNTAFFAHTYGIKLKFNKNYF